MQLDLFDRPPEPKSRARLYVFPLARRDALVDATAGKLIACGYDEGRRFWNAHKSAIRKELRALGLSTPEIRLEIDQYVDAVSHQISIMKKEVARSPIASPETGRNAHTDRASGTARGSGTKSPRQGSKGQRPLASSDVLLSDGGAA